MLATANVFPYVTLSLFCPIRLLAQKGLEVLVECVITIFWSLIFGSMMYSYIHLGHFAKKEVSAIDNADKNTN